MQTSDETILPGGCGVITDAGRTGSIDSVAGTDPAQKIREYLSRIPDWSRDAWARPMLQGVVIDLDGSGKTTAIRRIMMDCDAIPPDGADKGE